MKNFLKYVLATITGIIIVSILFMVVMLASLSVMMVSGDKTTSITDNSVLVLKAGVNIPDKGSKNPYSGIDIINMTVTPAPGLNEILQNLKKAASDDKVKGVLIENGMIPPGWATTEELRDGLKKFRESGKFVIAWSDYLMIQEGYYLSAAADKIYINPSSTVDFKGLSGEILFYKKALEKLGVEVQVIRHGKFKGAVEPYILDRLSPENREQILTYVGSIWSHVLNNISADRGIPVEKLNSIADNLTGYVAQGAFESGLVDGLLYHDQLIDTLKVRSGLTPDDKIALVPMHKYTKVPESKKTPFQKNKISVVYASGSIVNGKGNENNIGGDAFRDVIRKERKDSTVKAIVLRVNSRGGSAIASDMIWRELELAAKDKPVVISMGNYAASGGYFIAAPGTKVMASPTTITGSIGVFGLIPNTGKLMEQKLGVTYETVETNSNSDFPSVYRSMNTVEKEAMQRSIEVIYSDFVNKVSAGRKMTFNEVDSIAQGRVWSGSDAMRIGLVDSFGGLTDAVAEAGRLAGLEAWSLRELPVSEDPFLKMISQFGAEIKNKILKNELGEFERIFDDLREIRDFSGIQARLPYYIELH
ncbi:MAG TPA: signal peptide peptidase SppA [Bacteroidales bacterium]|jgi:protease-4|nr:signal peptide peptidase SppA [Bacteroidales bacterium]HNY53086.1 signal peptide peptidase SppA [Bacteroidales bacterium]HOG56517.1 signal peptide peptidase SppA [Bacteroidales bacterium]HPV16654.1 signal peptide peptidase SppA [Bacteroidales bacterium]HPX43567.1 signal peptide peptidase SppA [Bacteroidales bacterium]